MNNINVTSKEKKDVSVDRQGIAADRPYREIPGLRRETKDVLKQLDANITSLEDVGGRLSYMMTELRSLIRR